MTVSRAADAITADDLDAVGQAFEDTPRFSSRPSLAGLCAAAGVFKLVADSPAEDVRDAFDRLKAEAVAAQLDATDRATLIKLVLDALAAAGIKHARPLVKAALDAPSTREAVDRGTSIALADDEPADHPVPLGTLLAETIRLITDHVVIPSASAIAIALWIAAAYVIDGLSLMPVLLVSSPTKRAGKTTLVTLISALVPRALVASNATGIVLAHAIQRHRPTLILDEADTWLTSDDANLRGIINAGHTRETAHILRCATDTQDPQLIACFAARVFAMIQTPADTILDRSIVIELRRRRRDEPIVRLRQDRIKAQHAPLRRQWRRWALDSLDVIREADPIVPDDLHDRAADNWRPLLAAADLAGGRWPVLARAAALELSNDQAESISVELLDDIRSLYDDEGAGRPAPRDEMSSADLVAALVKLDGRPWADWSKGRPITQAKVARLLKAFGVVPIDMKVDGKTLRRYPRKPALEDAWTRYLPSKVQPLNPANVYAGELQDSKVQPDRAGCSLQSSTGPINTGSGCGVEPSKPDPRGGRLFFEDQTEDGDDDSRY